MLTLTVTLKRQKLISIGRSAHVNTAIRSPYCHVTSISAYIGWHVARIITRQQYSMGQHILNTLFLRQLSSCWDGSVPEQTGLKSGGRGLLSPLPWGELGPHLTPCHLCWGLPQYQVASWSIKPFGHNRMSRKVGDCSAPFRGGARSHLTQCGLGWGLPHYQVASWSIQPFGHNTLTLQTDRTGQLLTKSVTDSSVLRWQPAMGCHPLLPGSESG